MMDGYPINEKTERRERKKDGFVVSAILVRDDKYGQKSCRIECRKAHFPRECADVGRTRVAGAFDTPSMREKMWPEYEPSNPNWHLNRLKEKVSHNFRGRV